MIPNSLISRANLIFQEQGGFNLMQNVYTDTQVVDICLFNGYTATLFPKFSFNLLSESFNSEIYNLLDLSEIEYYEGKSYSVLDAQRNFLYSDTPTLQTIQGITGYFYGLTTQDIAFLKTTKQGDLYYLYYPLQDKNEYSLAQILISELMPVSLIKGEYGQWVKGLNDLHTQDNSNIRELILYVGTLHSLQLASLVGQLSDNLTEVIVAHSPRANRINPVYTGSLYMTFPNSRWLSFRDYIYLDNLSYITYLDNLYNELDTLVIGEGYNLVYNKINEGGYLEYVYSQVDSTRVGYNLELIVTVGPDGYVLSIDCASYKVLQMTGIKGARAYNFRVFGDYSVYVQVNEQEISSRAVGNSDLKGQTGLSFMDKSAMSVSATLV